MFEKGEYIVYGHNGICEVEDITHLNLSGVDKGKLYYVLAPLNKKAVSITLWTEKKMDVQGVRSPEQKQNSCYMRFRGLH